MPSASPMSVSVVPQRSSSRYQSALLRASRETSNPSMMPTWPRRDFGSHVSEAGTLGQPGARDAEILVENFNLLVLPAQLNGTIGELVLALSRFSIVFDLCRGGLTDV